MARGPSADQQWRALPNDGARCSQTSEIATVGRLLAEEGAMTDYVVTGLVKRRAEIAGKIEHLHEELSKLLADLDAIDKALGVFDPTIACETIKPKAFRPPSDWSNYGETSRIALNILRGSSEPL